MSDPLAVSERSRRALGAALVGYVVLYLVHLATGSEALAGLADLLLAAFVVPGSALVVRRIHSSASDDVVPVVLLVTVFLSGLAVGYGGLARLTVVPRASVLQAVATVALLAAALLYVYWRGRSSGDSR